MYEPAHFIKIFVSDLEAAWRKLKPNAKMTQLLKVLAVILLTSSVSWAKCELGRI